MEMTILLHPKFRIVFYAIFAGTAYYILAKLGIVLSSPPEYLASFWPANSIILVALLFTERRFWWLLILVTAPTYIISSIQTAYSIEQAMIFYTANSVEVLIAAFSLQYFLKKQINFDRLRDMIQFLLWAVFISPMTSAFIASFSSFNQVEVDYWHIWHVWFLANALGHLALTPLIIIFMSHRDSWLKNINFSRLGEALLLILGLIIVCTYSLGSGFDTSDKFPALLYTPIPFFLWAALRFGPKGIGTAILITTVLTIWNTINNRGPFIMDSPLESTLSLQLFLIAFSIPIMLLGSLFAEQKKVGRTLQESNDLFTASFSNTSIGMALVSLEHKIIKANQSLCDMLGYSQDELTGCHFKSITHVDDLDKSVEYHQNLVTGKIKNYYFEKRYIHKEGHNVWGLLSVSLIRNKDNSPPYIITQIQDITERKQANELLSYQASHDALTGLVNRREFERRAERLLQTITKEKNGQHAICYLDLDQFKVINDSCGHNAGDELLRQISSVLKNVIRHRDTLARLGGDEFGVLMEYCSLDDAHRVASSLQKAIRDYSFNWEDHTFKIGGSIGLVPITESIPSLNELLKEADAACYIAKEKGRNRIHVYHAGDSEIAKRHGEMQWVERLYQALDEDRFCLFAQTIVPLNGSKDIHYELLIRMINEEGELIPPDAFLPAAERYNLISRIDHWVIEKTFSVLQENKDFLNNINFCSINLSGSSLTDANILDFIIERLETTGIEANKLCFEITETAAILNLNNAIKFISILRNLGCRFALDDFGSGLSSFAYLKNLQVDYLKIDGMFVKDIADDPIDRAMVKSINEIGQVMGMETIAEFVETNEVKGMLTESGVNFAQGFGIGKPMPIEDLF